MRCDLHVHTIHSGLCTVPVANRFCQESYTEPEALYERLRQLGMDLVTVTDHDSIDAAERLRSKPDFFLSEEVTCLTPGGAEAHIGVYGISDRDHIELQRRRGDPDAFAAYVLEKGLLASINHPFSGLTGARSLSDFEWFVNVLPAIEIRNGAMLAVANQHAGAVCAWLGKAPVGGSDAHILKYAGSTWTEVRGARSAAEYLAGVRQGRGIVFGSSGGYGRLTRTVFQISCELMTVTPWTRFLAPLLLTLPPIVLVNYWREGIFAWRWNRKLRAAWGIPSRPLPGALAKAPGRASA
jgi:predicted metal-dependent phosphoesterase TrpH